jgi:prepilin-type N-terminal cleavage/methylation domain-containing protein
MRKAFTLIELIISIVIIGIAASALPTMIAGANKLEEDTVNQDIFSK